MSLVPLGYEPFGSSPLAGDPFADPPTVQILSPTTSLPAPGPLVTVSWDYQQPQGKPQLAWRVIFGDYDSGWRAGDDSSHVVDVRDLGMDGNVPDVVVEVRVRSTSSLDEASLAMYEARDTANPLVVWGQPKAKITSPEPDEVLGDLSGFDVHWDFNDSTSAYAQEDYRIWVRSNGATLFDSGWVVGPSDRQYRIDYMFFGGQQGRVSIAVRNENGILYDGAAAVPFSMSSVDVTDVVPDPNVGTIYEVGIQGRGYMLFDSPESEFQWRRSTISLDPPRFATGDTPFSQAFERYSFASQSGWSGGVGQQWLNRPNSDPSMFWKSYGVDPFSDPGAVRLSYEVDRLAEESSSIVAMVPCGDHLLWAVGTDLTWFDGTLETTFAAGGTVTDLAWSGSHWYAALGAGGVLQGTEDSGSVWSNIQMEQIDWAADRIVGVTTGGVFTSLAPDGTEETNGGLRSFTGKVHLGGVANGFYYFAHNRSLYAWPLGLDETGNQQIPFVALDFDAGEEVLSVGVAGGAVFAETARLGRRRFWRTVSQATGGLLPSLFYEAESPPGIDDFSGWAASGDMMFFINAASNAIGAYYLPTGGYVEQYLYSGAVPRISVWGSRVVWTRDFNSPYYVEAQSADLRDEGSVTLSIADAASSMEKVWSDVTVVTDPLPNNTSVEIEYSIDGLTWKPLATIANAGSTTRTFPLNVKASMLTLRATLKSADGVSTPTIRVFSGKFHPLAEGDTILVLPVLCADQVSGLNNHPIPESGPGAAAVTARRLQALSQQRVLVQDVDWLDSGVSEVFEVVQVDVRRLAGIRESAKRAQANAFVAVVTLRKVGV